MCLELHIGYLGSYCIRTTKRRNRLCHGGSCRRQQNLIPEVDYRRELSCFFFVACLRKWLLVEDFVPFPSKNAPAGSTKR